MNAPDWSAKGRRQLLHASVVSVFDADDLDLEWRAPTACHAIPVKPWPSPETAYSALYPCDGDGPPILFIGAERASAKGGS